MKNHYRGSLFCDPEAVVYAPSYDPCNIIAGAKHADIVFITCRDLLIYQEIADFFETLHAQGHESIPWFPLPYFQGELQLTGIQCGQTPILGYDKIRRPFNLFYTQLNQCKPVG